MSGIFDFFKWQLENIQAFKIHFKLSSIISTPFVSYPPSFTSFNRHGFGHIFASFPLHAIKFRYDSSIMTLLCRNNCIKLRTSTKICTNNLNFKCTRWSEAKMDFEIWSAIWEFKMQKTCLSLNAWQAWESHVGVIYLQSIQHTQKTKRACMDLVKTAWKRSWTKAPLGIQPFVPASVLPIPFINFHCYRVFTLLLST